MCFKSSSMFQTLYQESRKKMNQTLKEKVKLMTVINFWQLFLYLICIIFYCSSHNAVLKPLNKWPGLEIKEKEK